MPYASLLKGHPAEDIARLCFSKLPFLPATLKAQWRQQGLGEDLAQELHRIAPEGWHQGLTPRQGGGIATRELRTFLRTCGYLRHQGNGDGFVRSEESLSAVCAENEDRVLARAELVPSAPVGQDGLEEAIVALVREFLPEHEREILGRANPAAQGAAFASPFEDRYFPLHPPFRDGMVEGYSDLTTRIPALAFWEEEIPWERGAVEGLTQGWQRADLIQRRVFELAEELQARWDFYRDAVVMPLVENRVITTRMVSARDVALALLKEVPLSSGLLPQGALWWGQGRDGPVVALWRPPRVYAAKERPKTPEDMLYPTPLFNVFRDGRTCPGTHKYPQDIGEIPESFFQGFFSPTGDHAGRSLSHPDNLLEPR